MHLFPGQLVTAWVFQYKNTSEHVLRGSHQNGIAWVGREPRGSWNPTYGLMQCHPKSRPYICECCSNAPWTPADLALWLLPCPACVPASGGEGKKHRLLLFFPLTWCYYVVACLTTKAEPLWGEKASWCGSFCLLYVCECTAALLMYAEQCAPASHT